MVQLIAAALILWGGIAGIRWAARADRRAVAPAVKRTAGALACAAAAAFLLLRGNIDAALPLAALAAWLLGWEQASALLPAWFPGARRRTGAFRVYRTPTLELRYDPTSGAMDGRVSRGRFAGARLASLTAADCAALRAECERSDPDGARLLDFYVHRRFPRGHAAEENDGDAGRRSGFGAREMTQQDAYQMLGLHPGASREEVTRAHRALMKKAHPDHGGSASWAALLNEAKDILTRRHR